MRVIRLMAELTSVRVHCVRLRDSITLHLSDLNRGEALTWPNCRVLNISMKAVHRQEILLVDSNNISIKALNRIISIQLSTRSQLHGITGVSMYLDQAAQTHGNSSIAFSRRHSLSTCQCGTTVL